jgi:hypothetical protein
MARRRFRVRKGIVIQPLREQLPLRELRKRANSGKVQRINVET